MYLYLDNSQDGLIVIIELSKKGIIKIKKFKNPSRKSLLYFLDKFLMLQKKKLREVRGVAILMGQGRFTATRIAATTVNTLAYVLKIPVISVTVFDEKLILKKLPLKKVGQYIAASYSAEAHIDGKQQ